MWHAVGGWNGGVPQHPTNIGAGGLVSSSTSSVVSKRWRKATHQANFEFAPESPAHRVAADRSRSERDTSRVFTPDVVWAYLLAIERAPTLQKTGLLRDPLTSSNRTEIHESLTQHCSIVARTFLLAVHRDLASCRPNT